MVSRNYNITKEVSFTNFTSLKFIGNNAEIRCIGDEVGLAFIRTSNVTLDGITFRQCGATRNCTSKLFSTDELKHWCTFKVGLYFYLCDSIKLLQVGVTDGPNATGVVMYDTRGTNMILNSHFTNNSVSGLSKGGGGFYLEFTYCAPGSINCTEDADVDNYSVAHSSYEFDSVVFESNKANNEGYGSSSTYIMPSKSNHQSLGRGGGLCMYIKGKAKSNSITLRNCTFKNNSAQWGAGVMLEFHDNTTRNKVTFDQCIFENNNCTLTIIYGTGGGGMRLGHYVFGLDKIFKSFLGNNVLIQGCNFSNNYAMYGGGLSVSAGLELLNPYGKQTLINISGVQFKGNIAKFGSALHVSRYPFSSQGVMLTILLKSVKFMNNSANYTSRLLGKPRRPRVEGIGTLYINQVDVKFSGSVFFADNNGTGVAVAGSLLDLMDSNMTFVRNVGYRGGALSLLGCAHILINDNTVMKFENNHAKVEGGAMYVRYVEMDNSRTFFNCFIKHIDPYLNPNEWKSNITFIGNKNKNGPNSIHSTSIYPCGWAGGTSYTLNKSDIFCWTNWNYFNHSNDPVECSSEITTDAGDVTFKQENVTELLEVIPGHNFQLPLEVMDDYGNSVINATVYSSFVNDSRVKSPSYIWGGSASVEGSSDVGEAVLSLESMTDVIWRADIVLSLQQCPPGLQGNNCSCAGSYGGAVSCDSHSFNVTIRVQNWIGLVNSSYLVGLCPPTFCKQARYSSIVLPNNSDTAQLDQTVCEGHRTKELCGSCTHGYSPAVNSNFNCVVCNSSNIYIAVVKYISSVYIPLIIFSVVLIVFDIRLTTGPVNAFILFSQMVTTTFTLTAYGQIPFHLIVGKNYDVLKKLLVIPYGIFNLEFAENLLHPFCIRSNYTALDILVLEYGVASFPLLMIVVATLCLKLKECCCSMCSRLSLKIVRNVRCCNKSNISQALLPAFASFILLSYHKFSLTSVYLMSSQSLIDENGNFVDTRVYFAGHLNMSNPHYVRTYFIPSVLVSILLFAFPILLLGYPLMLLEKCLFKIKPLWKFYPAAKIHFFLDTFHGCYKIKYQFFSGLYFLFRSCMNITYLSAEYWIIQFVVQQLACVVMVTLVATIQPYKQKYLNYVDALIFANLAFLNTLSLYMYFTYQSGHEINERVFVVQYFLMSLPLFYIIGVVIYYFWRNKIKDNINLTELRNIVKIRRKSRESANMPNERAWLTQESDEELFARAENSIHNTHSSQCTKPDGGRSSNDSTSSATPLRSSTGTAYGTMTSASTGTNNNSS